MTRLNQAGQAQSLGQIDTTQGQFRSQIDVVADELLQLAGDADTGPGVALDDIDPLNAPFILYVNPYIGRDYYAPGSYTTTADDNTAAQELRRIDEQRLLCGYTEARPFRTINRAVIEAGLITSKAYFSAGTQPFQLVAIVLAPGVHIAMNDVGNDTVSEANFPEWTPGDDGFFSPTDAQLMAFNPEAGGILLPRGTSLCSLDLRKCTIRPQFVPNGVDEEADYGNRSSIFRVTGEGYYFGFTFRDSLNNPNTSHHLLSCFEFGSEAQLDLFYQKLAQSFVGVANSQIDATATRDAEWQIVGPRPAASDNTVDTTASASPYIYNCSIRSEWGLCGVFANGAEVGGFQSMVIAQFTGVSLQREMACWETYASGTWSSNPSYANYIAAGPDNTRMRTTRRSFHIRAVNNAVIQEVSVFAIGQGVHHWVENGGELTVTNSNSNFGGCAAIAEGYRGINAVLADQNAAAFPQDRSWALSEIQVATDLSDETNNVRRIFLGTLLDATQNDATALGLTVALEGEADNLPSILADDNYSTRADSLLWVENPGGLDYRAPFANTGWDTDTPAVLQVTAAMVNQNDEAPNGTNERPNLAGRRVYVRRLRDTRSIEERSYALRANTSEQNSRTPLRDYVLQTTVGVNNVTDVIPPQSTIAVLASAPRPAAVGSVRSAVFELTRVNATGAYSETEYYRPGDRILRDNKHFQCTATGVLGAFDVAEWQEVFVHTETDYRPEDFFKNKQPVIVFDNDTDAADESSQRLGYTFNGTATSSWFTDPLISVQLRSGTDYRGMHSFLRSMGFSDENAHRILIPEAAANRLHQPTGAINGSGNPSGGAVSDWGSWGLNFRRPSNIRLFGHAFEWAGYLNYSKALPEYQLELTPGNKFTYYATNVDGGRVFFSGFNEEGFTVSPRGVEDIQTGDVLSSEQVGNVDREIETITEFPLLNVDELRVGILWADQIIGDITWGNAQFPLDGSWTRQGTDIPAATGPLPRLPDAQTPDNFPVTEAEAAQTRGITRYAMSEEVDAVWTAANAGTPPAEAGSETAAVTPASLYSMVQDIVAAITGGNQGAVLAPTGMVGYFASATAPTGLDNDGGSTNQSWLPCDGRELNTFTWRRLHAVISNTFGGTAFVAGTTDQDGATTTFNLPDLRGQFVRGFNEQDSTGPDAGRTFGDNQADELRSHNHAYAQWTFQNTATQPGPSGGGTTVASNTGATGGDETRPVNVALLPMIKT